MSNDAKSRRCSPCDWNWPAAANYEKCPMCLAETDPDKDLKPDEGSFGKAQAWKAWHANEALARAAFDRTLAELDEQFEDYDSEDCDLGIIEAAFREIEKRQNA